MGGFSFDLNTIVTYLFWLPLLVVLHGVLPLGPFRSLHLLAVSTDSCATLCCAFICLRFRHIEPNDKLSDLFELFSKRAIIPNVLKAGDRKSVV